MVPITVVVVVDVVAIIWWFRWGLCGGGCCCCCCCCGPLCCCCGRRSWSSGRCSYWWFCWLRSWHWRPRTCFKVRRIFRSTYTALTVFTPAALNQKVTLGREVGEPGALWVLSAKLLALFGSVRVSVVVDDVVLGEVACPLNIVPPC